MAEVPVAAAGVVAVAAVTIARQSTTATIGRAANRILVAQPVLRIKPIVGRGCPEHKGVLSQCHHS